MEKNIVVTQSNVHGHLQMHVLSFIYNCVVIVGWNYTSSGGRRINTRSAWNTGHSWGCPNENQRHSNPTQNRFSRPGHNGPSHRVELTGIRAQSHSVEQNNHEGMCMSFTCTHFSLGSVHRLPRLLPQWQYLILVSLTIVCVLWNRMLSLAHTFFSVDILHRQPLF